MYSSNIIVSPMIGITSCKFNRNSLDMIKCRRPWKINLKLDTQKKKKKLFSNILPAAGSSVPSSGAPPHSWKSWVLGMAITLIVPFLRTKLGPFFFFSNRIVQMVETIETVVDTVEKTAETVAKVAEEFSDQMPEGGKMRNAVDLLETLAKETAKDAHLVGDVIDKAQDVEDEIKDLINNKESEEIEKSETKQ